MLKKCRSGFERAIYRFLKGTKGVTFWYEPCVIPYVIQKTYKPDFVIYKGKLKKPKKPLTFDELKGMVLIEAKGYFTSADRTKMKLVKEQHPDLDIRMLFMADNKLTKKSKTTYSQWAEKNGFVWAVGDEVPKEWYS